MMEAKECGFLGEGALKPFEEVAMRAALERAGFRIGEDHLRFTKITNKEKSFRFFMMNATSEEWEERIAFLSTCE